MANYTSTHTGQQIDTSITKVLELVNTSTEINTAVGRALSYDDFESIIDENVDNVIFRIFWKVKPTSSNTVYGFAVHPQTGKLCTMKSTNGTITVDNVSGEIPTIATSEVDDLFK